jgi:hypothetical protein
MASLNLSIAGLIPRQYNLFSNRLFLFCAVKNVNAQVSAKMMALVANGFVYTERKHYTRHLVCLYV